MKEKEKKMKKENTPATKIDKGTLIGAAFLMATSAIGPGFLTQTATFTEKLGPTFGFVILISVIMALIAQLNVWRIIGVSGLRGQDVSNKVLPGLGIFIAVLVAIGGLVFNIGNVGGAALGMEGMFGMNQNLGIAISAAIAVLIFLNKNAGKVMDRLTTVLGALMIVLIFIVMIATKPPVGEALKRTVMPETFPYMAILTLVGGTVGGYITFSGAHRLLDTGKSGIENLDDYNRSSKLGMTVATIVRILLFLAVLGVVSQGLSLDPHNPAGDAFLKGAGQIGYRFFGLVLFSAAISSVVGCAYTSVSFLTVFEPVSKNRNLWTIIFIVVSSLIMMLVGKPAKLLVVAGSVNGLILPITLGAMLVASRKKEIVGDYQHSKVLFYLGIVVVIVTAIVGIKSLAGMKALFS